MVAMSRPVAYHFSSSKPAAQNRALGLCLPPLALKWVLKLSHHDFSSVNQHILGCERLQPWEVATLYRRVVETRIPRPILVAWPRHQGPRYSSLFILVP